jgi:hypothetical protein
MTVGLMAERNPELSFACSHSAGGSQTSYLLGAAFALSHVA